MRIINKKTVKKLAFTLAEVLIVVGIIGIVAEMTIPTLVYSFRRQVAETKLKEGYSILTQMMTLSTTDNGDPSTWNIQDGGYDVDAFFNKYFLPYVKKDGGVVADNIPNLSVYDSVGNQQALSSVYTSNAYQLPDGMMLSFQAALVGWESRKKGSFFLYTDPNQSKQIEGKNFFIFNLIIDGGTSQITSGQDYGNESDLNCGLVDSDATVHAQSVAKCLDSSLDPPMSGSSPISCTSLIECHGWSIPKDYPIKF